MPSDELENLVRIGQLRKEPPRADELLGLRRSGLARIADAERSELSFESRFDLAYNAAHALAP
jgi:ethanolamine ammonia-lyase small subunit